MKMSARRLGAALATTVAVVGITTVLSPPAQASGDTVYWARAYDPTYGDETGRAYFYSDVDEFHLWDQMQDLHGVVLHINLSDDEGETYHRWKNLYNGGDYDGAGAYKAKVWGFDAEFTEGRFFAFQVCRQDGINQASFHCGGWTKGTA